MADIGQKTGIRRGSIQGNTGIFQMHQRYLPRCERHCADFHARVRSLTGGIRVLFFLLPLMMLFSAVRAEAMTQEGKLVRVGWYESAFHKTDPFGRKSGYGYEYQMRIANLTGWRYEYVEGSWSELFEMLVEGKIDLLSDVSYTEERAKKILFSAEAMGSEDYHVFIAPDNSEISPDDFSTFNGKRVGVNKNSIQEQLFLNWAEEHDVKPLVEEFTVKTPELLEMLERGEIDALVTLDTYGVTADVVSVCKVGSANSYFGISEKREDIKKELDAAMNRILENNRSFNEQLTEKFNKASSISHYLTLDEKNWVEKHRVIKVGYLEDYLPFCDMGEDAQTVTGALSDYLAFAETCEKNARLSFEPCPFASTKQGLTALKDGEIDCLFPINLSAYDGEKQGLLMSDPLFSTEMFAAARPSDQRGFSGEGIITVALPQADPSYETFVMDSFPAWRVVYYKDTSACFDAVVNGDADCLLISSYRLNRTRKDLQKNGLSTFTIDAAMDCSFAVRREDHLLYSILNKVNQLMPEPLINASLNSYSHMDDHVTLGDFLRDNAALAVAAVAVIFSAILLLILRNMRSEMKSKESSLLISEAERDKLTNLYNRNFFFAYANRFYRQNPNWPMDAIVMNIERFHALNRLYGYGFGDEVLKALGREIEVFLTETEGYGARLDGDYFNIYCSHQEDYGALLERFQKKLSELSRNSDIRLRMGVMPWQPSLEPEPMFDFARTACVMVRGNYRTTLKVYNEELSRQDHLNQRLRADFARGLAEHEFEIFYQPKFNIQMQEPTICSAEALVRWHHHELGDIMPGTFIPLFERSGQISELDQYVWSEAARQVADWRDRTGIILPVSVNLSRIDLVDPDLPEILDRLVKENGLDRKMIDLEITESAYTESADSVIRAVSSLREKGYSIEMDDFGSGYSSLNMLSSMPVDVLKMDMRFVQNIESSEKDYRLVTLILDIARNMNLCVVAEGVETSGQFKLLRDAGCDMIQGYFFSRPLSAEDFERKMIKGREEDPAAARKDLREVQLEEGEPEKTEKER